MASALCHAKTSLSLGNERRILNTCTWVHVTLDVILANHGLHRKVDTKSGAKGHPKVETHKCTIKKRKRKKDNRYVTLVYLICDPPTLDHRQSFYARLS